MGNNTRMGECVNIDVTSGPSSRTAASVARTYSNTPPQFANVWLLFLFILLISHSHDYYIPILSCTFHTTFIQTCVGAEETYGALTLCRGASVSTPEIGDTSVVVSTWEFFSKVELIMSGFLKKRYNNAHWNVNTPPPFFLYHLSHRTYIYRCAWLYQKPPKNVNTNAKKDTLLTEHHLSAYSISVFFFSTHNYGQASLPLVYKLRNHTPF